MSANANSPVPDPLVSVIVPAYNYGHVIGQTLQSVLAQTYPHLECIVVDDGSADDTGRVVEGYAARDPRVRLLRQRNAGVAAARNNGTAHSRGEYFQFLDADDLIEPRKLELQVAYLEAHAEADIVYGSARYFRTEKMDERLFSMFDEHAESSYIPQLSAGEGGALRTLVRSVMPINAPLVRRRVVEEVGPFDTSFNSVADWDFWTRCAARGVTFQYYDPPDTLALVRSHPTSMSKDRRGAFREALRLRDKLARTIADREALDANRAGRGEDEGYLGIEEAAAGRRLRGVYHMLKAGLISRGARQRVKWLACALAAPVARGESLMRLPVTPVSRWERGMFFPTARETGGR